MSRLGVAVIALLIAACDSETSGADAGNAIPCPGTVPAASAGCTTGARCTYLDCSAAGVSLATCAAGSWNVTTSSCAPAACAGAASNTTCEAGQLCVVRAGGAFLVECTANPCGAAPLEDCACGMLCGGNPCAVNGLTLECNTCSSGLCP